MTGSSVDAVCVHSPSPSPDRTRAVVRSALIDPRITPTLPAQTFSKQESTPTGWLQVPEQGHRSTRHRARGRPLKSQGSPRVPVGRLLSVASNDDHWAGDRHSRCG
jgi:hypothetical protein